MLVQLYFNRYEGTVEFSFLMSLAKLSEVKKQRKVSKKP